ncbi:MAG: hypothetical protein J7L34_01700 [Thermotogaceae bacterium]|nr:hypothetical protein [Thermotogaceae bacterium]
MVRRLAVLVLLVFSLFAIAKVCVEKEFVVFELEGYQDAETVYLAGSFNGWKPTATKMEMEDGKWIVKLKLDPGIYQYKFVVNGKEWIADSDAPAFADDGFGGKNGVFMVYREFGALRVGVPASKSESKGPDPSKKPIKLILYWHHHQPLYKIPGSDKYMMPWVRAHGVNDYPYMADLVQDYLSTGKVVFNLVPSLLLQIQDYLKGTADEYQRLSLKPENQLTDKEKRFILDHFFDINPQFVNAHRRYRELMEKKVSGEDFTDQDFLDLKVCWNLYWINIDYINADPVLKALTEKEHYTREDLEYILKKHKELLESIIPKYKKLWQEGKVELTTTPMYHPILPILIEMGWADDAYGQIKAGIEYFKKVFGKAPDGMWPSEEAVSQEAAALMAKAGVKWFITDQSILEKSGVSTADKRNLFKPYKLHTKNGDIVVFFRETDLSNRISFTYSQMSAEDAVNDFINALHNYQAMNDNGDMVITVALDGENAWEHYKNNGNDFRKLLYESLSEDPYIELITPVEYIENYGVKAELDHIATGSWAGGNLDTWIGEKEENEAWDRLKKAREVLIKAMPGFDEETKQLAINVLYAAEGSDWFWWYGDDQDAGHNEVLFDMQFKNLLIKMYELAGCEKADIPSYLFIPNKKPASATEGVIKKVEYHLNGELEPQEKLTALFDDSLDKGLLRKVYVGRSDTSVYVAVVLNKPAKDYIGENIKVQVYFDSPHADKFNARTKYSKDEITPLGFALSHMVSVNLKLWEKKHKLSTFYANGKDKWILGTGNGKVAVGDVIEFEIPYDFLRVKSGEEFNLAVVVSERLNDVDFAPDMGPVNVKIPAAVSGELLATFVDPEGDEYGPGCYTYPKDPAFKPYKGLFDLLKVNVLENDEAFVFQFYFKEMTNPWGAPKGFSHQLINIYLDAKDGGSTNTYKEGAKVQFDPEHPWDYFVKVAGWPGYGQFFATAEGEEKPGCVRVEADPAEKLVNVIVYKKCLKIDGNKMYAYFIIGSQDGYGPDNFRPVTPEAGQWTLGGYPKDAGDFAPFAVDIVAPDGYTQEEVLSSYSKKDKHYAILIPVEINVK